MKLIAISTKGDSLTFEGIHKYSFIAKTEIHIMNLNDITLHKQNKELAVITVHY